MLNLIQHLISRANQTLKQVQGDAIWVFEIASSKSVDVSAYVQGLGQVLTSADGYADAMGIRVSLRSDARAKKPS